jgi:hypothetical protein
MVLETFPKRTSNEPIFLTGACAESELVASNFIILSPMKGKTISHKVKSGEIATFSPSSEDGGKQMKNKKPPGIGRLHTKNGKERCSTFALV